MKLSTWPIQFNKIFRDSKQYSLSLHQAFTPWCTNGETLPTMRVSSSLIFSDKTGLMNALTSLCTPRFLMGFISEKWNRTCLCSVWFIWMAREKYTVMFIFFKKMVFKIKGYHLIREMRFDRWEISTTVAIICSLSPLSSSVSYCLHLVREFKMITFIWYLLTWEQKAEERQEEGNTQKDSMIKSLGRVFPYLIFPLKLTRTCFNSEEGCIPTVMVWFKVEPLHEAMSQ